MLLKYPWILSTGVIENYKRILLFFKQKKVTEKKKKLLCMFEFPAHLFTLFCLLFAVLGVVNQLFCFQISSTVLGIAVKSWPHILGCSTKRMNSILEIFDDLGISKKMVVPVITSSPQLLLRKSNEFLQVCNHYYIFICILKVKEKFL